MKVLWITNMVFPDAADKLGIKTSSSGGWLLDLAKSISKSADVELCVMTYSACCEFYDIHLDEIRHLIFPGGGKRLLYDNPKTIDDCKKAVELFKPDLIHIHGTEYAPGYAMLKSYPQIPTLLTIQGIIKRISEEYYGGLKTHEILKISFKYGVKSPIAYKWLYSCNAKREEKVLAKVKYVTGRTDWDKATMMSINPDLQYYRCNYNLRDEFYSAPKWSIEKIQRHTIMTGASLYPLKGLHILIKALQFVKKEYPDVMLYVPGGSAANGRILNPKGYMKFIEDLIKKYNLEENIYFTGAIPAKEVAEHLKTANVCVVPSAIEGASATLCEAMMIGTPSICSFRGGMTDLLTDKVNGFTYDYPEYPLLAHRIMEIFENDEMACDFSKRSIELAEDRHNRERNPKEMIEVYKEVLENEC